ncbi:MAG: Rieske 2Fe-2S domain-containing protein [Aquabacterium sp.]|uniref:Rieske (2Fe-2S) protein n=1 Tax=Aquabacterium sp. G14 TaxID=3130164 RepID=UPI0011D3ED25|nr:MAG: Rieske 2Fe-2S domain-containing protein [Aquabacterium sp.]
MPESWGEPEWLCASADLRECGDAVMFEVLENGLSVSAFAVRFRSVAVAYLNRCAHLPAQMDWQPGRFWDVEGRYIVCAMHGALYDPPDGRCVLGPCRGAHLTAITLTEKDGQVYWYPSQHLQPVF